MNKRLKNRLFLLAGLLLLNFINQDFYKRFDLTADGRYTLSKTTLNILDKINNQVVVKVYLEGDFPSEFKRLQLETRQFLEELKAKNKNINIQFINPDTRRESLIKKGMSPSRLTVEEDGKLSESIIFPWAEIRIGKKTILISLLPNSIIKTQEEQLENAIENLEFSFVDALNSMVQKKQKKIAILSGNGELKDIELYSFLSDATKKYRLAKFTLDSVATNPQKTLQDLTTFDLAIIAKPSQKFTAAEKFTIDQFMTNGGKLLWLLDNVQADQDSLFNNGKMLAYPRDLNLTDLLFSYGVRVNTNLIKDLYAAKIALATGNTGNKTQFQNLNWYFHPLASGNPNHPITKNMLPVRLQFATQIDTLKNNIKKTPLLASSILTKKIGTPTIITLQSIATEPKENEYKSGNQLFGILLEGNFNSGYKNRVKPFKTLLYKEQSTVNKMVVIADGDIAKNQILKGKPHDLSFDKWTNEQFGNKTFLLNTVDYLLDDTNLILLRNKSLQLATLNKQKAFEERTFWQFINIVLPLLLFAIFGFLYHFFRKKKYT